MKNNPHLFKPNLTVSGNLKQGLSEPFKYCDWQTYLEKMAMPRMWGTDELIIKALSLYLQSPIIKFNSNAPEEKSIIYSETEQNDPIFIGHIKDYHYVGLRMPQKKTPRQVYLEIKDCMSQTSLEAQRPKNGLTK